MRRWNIDRLSTECRSTINRVSTATLTAASVDITQSKQDPSLLGQGKWLAYGDFVTNSYGESWDSSCEKLWVPVQKWVWHWKCLGLYVTRPVNLKADSKTLYYWQYTEIKIGFFYLKAQQRLKEIYIVTQMGHFYKYTCSDWLIDWSLHPAGCMPWIILCL